MISLILIARTVCKRIIGYSRNNKIVLLVILELRTQNRKLWNFSLSNLYVYFNKFRELSYLTKKNDANILHLHTKLIKMDIIHISNIIQTIHQYNILT